MPRHPGAEAVEQLRKDGHDDLARQLQCYINQINHERAELKGYARDTAELLEKGPPFDAGDGWKKWAFSCA
jgi:hypothetical protein